MFITDIPNVVIFDIFPIIFHHLAVNDFRLFPMHVCLSEIAETRLIFQLYPVKFN